MMTTRKLAAVAMLIVGLAVGLVGSIFIGTSTLRETRTPTSTATATSTTATTTVPTPATIPAHRIGVRVVDGVGEFYDRETGERFVPRGSNYVRLAMQRFPNGDVILYHSLLNPGLYDTSGVDQALGKMRSIGYNVVRVFINECCMVGSVGDPAGGVSSAYVANMVDFLRRAKANEVYVLIVGGNMPEAGGYQEYLKPYSSTFQHWNPHVLSPGGVEAHRRFWQDFVRELINQEAPLDAIFAYDIRNEVWFSADFPPLSWMSGLVTTGNGKTYDMSKPDEKQKMMDENLVYWIDQVRTAILDLDPTALVTVSFFVPEKPHPFRPGDPRVIRTGPAIWESSADFIDLHAWPWDPPALVEHVENFEVAGFTRKPIIMGEIGGFKGDPFWSAARAAQALHDWQVQSCGFGFDGWLLWTWDTFEQREFWYGLEEDGVINEALSPRSRPDPCQPRPFNGQNIAFLKPSKASRFLTTNAPSMAFDGKPSNWWGAGDLPLQWIEVDLQTPSTIEKVRLLVSQSPAGETVHRVLGKASAGEAYDVLHEFRGFTNDNDVLEYAPPTPWSGIRFIRTETVTSPSWVSWREIEVLRGPEQMSSAASSVQNTEVASPASRLATLCVPEQIVAVPGRRFSTIQTVGGGGTTRAAAAV